MARASKITLISNKRREERISKCQQENNLLDLQIKALVENKQELTSILASYKINSKQTYRIYVRYVKKYTQIKKEINKAKAKYISNQYYIQWLTINNVSDEKNNEYVYAENLYKFIKFVESTRSAKIFPYSLSKLNKLNYLETRYSFTTIKLMYLKEVKLRAAELAHKSTWSLKEKIKKTEHKIRISENKINDLKESFAARYLAGLVRKLEKSKKNSKAIADAQKLHAEQQKALTEAKKLKAVAQEKKHELKQDLKYRKYLLKKDLKNKHISKTDYSINKSKLVDAYHEDVSVLNKKIKDSFYNVQNYSTFDTCENAVDLRNVVKYYNNGYIATKVLDNVNLLIKKGEFVVILGPSGSGKTTLLNIISGMDNATFGSVFIADENIIDYNQTQLTTFRRKNIGYVFQQYGLLPNLTVRENVQMGQNLQANKAKALDVDLILESIGLGPHMNKYPNELSGGQQQRVSIARSIAKNPNILFGDEPTGAIDGEMSKEIMRLFIEINKRYHTTIIIVTHNPIIAELASMVINVSNGTISRIDKNTHPKKVDDLDWSTISKSAKKETHHHLTHKHKKHK